MKRIELKMDYIEKRIVYFKILTKLLRLSILLLKNETDVVIRIALWIFRSCKNAGIVFIKAVLKANGKHAFNLKNLFVS